MIIKIKNLRLKTIIGVYDYEQKINRDIIINATIETKHNDALVTDNLEDTIDYDNITQKIKQIVSSDKFKLIEKLAHEILCSIMSNKKVSYCQVEVDKVGAVENVDSLSILIEKRR